MVDRLRVTELDFDTIKANLKAFLKQQAEFQDYDFDGAGLSILLDILAYNTHYNAYYLNMVANESFLFLFFLAKLIVKLITLLLFKIQLLQNQIQNIFLKIYKFMKVSSFLIHSLLKNLQIQNQSFNYQIQTSIQQH